MTLEKRKYHIAVPDELHQTRDDCLIEADAINMADGHLWLYADGKVIAVFAPGGWHSVRVSGSWTRTR